MVHVRCAVLVAAAALLAASGCGKDREPEKASIRTVSGAARAAAGSAADGDTGDASAPLVHNDSFATAQPLPSAVTLGGWVSSSADREDHYRAALAEGQVVTLTIAAPDEASVDLELFAASDPTNAILPGAGAGTRTRTITVESSDEFHIGIRASGGASSYLLTLGPPAATTAEDEVPAFADFVPGQVIVRFRDELPPGHPADTLEARARAVGLVGRAGGPRRAMLMELGAGEDRARAFRALGIAAAPRLPGAFADPVSQSKADTLRVVEALRRRPDVATADVNHVVQAWTSDTYYARQWDLPAMRVPQAWYVTGESPASGDVVVAVVDTGIYGAHEDLVGKLVPGYDFITSATVARDGDGIDADPTDAGDSSMPGQSSFHGTHVAGTIGAARDNATGIAGVSGAKIMPVRVLGLGGVGTSYDIMQGVRFAAGLENDSGTLPAERADVINLSLGCYECFQGEMQEVVDQVYAAGVVVVAASGNEGTSKLSYPASYDHVLSVSAVGKTLARAPYSSYGPTVDVAAPGGSSGTGNGILSTVADDSGGAPRSAYAYMQGTSMAAPHFAGVVALMKEVCPTLSPGQVDAFLRSGSMTQDLGVAGRDDLYGFGLVDALASVQTAAARCTPPVPVPAVLDVSPTHLDLAPSGVTTVALTISKVGAGDLPDGALSVAKAGSWLAVAPGAVDETTRLGTYLATLDPTSVSTGVHAGAVTFTWGDQAATVPVTMHVGSTLAGAGDDAGHVYVLLLDERFEVASVQPADATGGAYPYSFKVPPGTYHLVAGSDTDGDGWICEAEIGESCGAYPTGDLPTELPAGGDLDGLEFSVGFDLALGAGAAAASWLPPQGFAIGPAPGAVQVKR